MAFNNFEKIRLKNFEAEGVSYEWETEPDRESFKRISVESFYQCYKNLSSDVLRVKSDTKQWLASHFTDEFIDGFKKTGSPFYLLAAKVNRMPVGYVIFDMGKYPQQVYISEMFVDPAFQRRGIGKQLVFSILHAFAKIDKLVLVTRKANSQACAFYPALGFKRSDYIHEGYDRELYIGFEYQKRN